MNRLRKVLALLQSDLSG